MSWHGIVLCEGAHDLAIVTALAQRLDGWKAFDDVPRGLPERLNDRYPVPKKNKRGAPQFDPLPSYLNAGDRWIEVRQLGGISRLLSTDSTDLLKQVKPDAVAVIVDANDVGVGTRVQQVTDLFSRIYPHAPSLRAGKVCTGVPALGLWVAPDNNSNGTLLDPMLAVASKAKPKLTRAAERFVTSCKKLEPGDWTKRPVKAILGAAGQTVVPGGSLAVALKECTWIAESDFRPGAPFQPLMDFLREITKA